MAKKQEQNTAKQDEEKQPARKFEEKQPIVSRNITLSNDGNWLIIKTVRTDIVHVNYMQKILNKGE